MSEEGGNTRSEGDEKSSSFAGNPAFLNCSNLVVGDVDYGVDFIDLHLDAPMAIFPSLETRHKRNAAKRRKREKIQPIHHLTTEIEVISKKLMAEGKLIPRFRTKSSVVAFVEEGEDEDDDEDADDDEEDDDEGEDYAQHVPYPHSSEQNAGQVQGSLQALSGQHAHASSQVLHPQPPSDQSRPGNTRRTSPVRLLNDSLNNLLCYIPPYQ